MKEKKKKESRLYIIVGIVGFVLGFLIAMTTDIIQMPEGFMKIPFFINILIFIFTFFITVTLHELGHALSFVINGIKIRAIFSTIFGLIKEDNKWKFKLTSMKVVGGIVIPHILDVKDEEDFQMKQTAFAKAIIMGPIASLLTWIALTVISSIIIKDTSNTYLRSGLLMFILYLTGITIFFLCTSFIKKDIAIGDFPAYKIVKEDRFFTAMQLYNYGYLSSRPEKARKENIFLRKYILQELEEKYKKKDSHSFTLNMIDTIIVEYLSGFLETLPPVIDDYIKFILESPMILSKIKSSIMLEILYFHIIMLLHRDEITKERAFQQYKDLKNTIESNTPKRKYLFKQIEQVLGIADNKEYLMDRRNIVTSDSHQIFKYFQGYYMDEIRLNEMI